MGIETTQPEGNVTLHCENCTKTLPTQFFDQNEVMFYARSEGWVSRMVGIVLCHYCPECK